MKKIISYKMNGKTYSLNKFMPLNEIHTLGKGITEVNYVSLIIDSGHIKSKEHYVNTCKKFIRNNIGKDFSESKELLNKINYIYDEGEFQKEEFIERNWSQPHYYFLYKIKNQKNPKTLKILINNIIRSIDNFKKGGFSILRGQPNSILAEFSLKEASQDILLESGWDYDISEEAKLLINNKKGIYKLFNDEKEVTYIGKSKNLLRRVMESIRMRLPKYISFIFIDNDADISVLEPYLISTLKPIQNNEFSSSDSPSFVVPVPDETKIFEIFKKEID